jgi:SOS-response transcriptional repressor LexA
MGGIGTNAVFGHLMALETKGYIEREAGLARAIRILARA